MRSAIIFVGAIFLSTVSCAQIYTGPPKIANTVWIHEGSDVARMCATFGNDGRFRIFGGYRDLQPAAWTGDASLVTIRLAGKLPFPTAVAEFQKKEGRLFSFNSERRELVYQLLGHKASFDFMGYTFYRAEKCDAA